MPKTFTAAAVESKILRNFRYKVAFGDLGKVRDYYETTLPILT